MLIADFICKKEAVISFSPMFNNILAYNAMKQFQLHINNMIADTNNICTHCNLFMRFGAKILLTKVYSDFVSIIKAAVMVNNDFIHCKYIDNNFHFCKSCHDMIVKKKILIFRSINYINILLC